MKYFLIFIFYIFVSSIPVNANEVLNVGGAGSTAGIFHALANGFIKSHPNIKLDWAKNLGSTGALKALPSGAIDLAFIAKLPNQEVLKDPSLDYRFVADSIFLFVANNDVFDANITQADLVLILNGKKNIWKNGERLRIVLRPANDSDAEVIANLSPELKYAYLHALERPGMVVAKSNQESLQIISKTPGALGFSSLAQMLTEENNAKILSYENKRGNAENLINKTYPLFKVFYIVYKKEPSRRVQAFIDFIFSKKGQAIIAARGNSLVKIGGEK